MIKADMHTHTIFSDGTLTPKIAVERAKNNGLGMLVITDHDNTNGSDEALALCRENGIKTVRGIEISAYDGDVKVHLLGYNFDDSAKVYRDFYAEEMEAAFERTEDILKKLKSVGVHISMDEVKACRPCKYSPLHSVYISLAAVKKGYAKGAGAFYVKYLNYGTVGFSVVRRPSPERAMQVIHEAGGICSLAHPGRISLSESKKVQLIERLKSNGLDCIEAVYTSHSKVETQYYNGLADRYNLLVTGGSDTHHPTGNRDIGKPEFYPDERLLQALKI